jgi:hypothetical protein
MSCRRKIAPLLAALALSAGLFATRPARANLFEFYVDAYGGGLYGTPQIAGYPHPPSTGDNFFHNQSGGLLGARAGVELLYTDLYLQFDQYFNGLGAAGSSLQLMLGWDWCIGRVRNGRGPCGLIGGYGGVVFGFPYTVQFPISRENIATFGVAAEAQGGFEYHLNDYFVFQALGTFGYNYLFRLLPHDTIKVDPATGEADFPTSHGFHLLAKVGMRFHIVGF